jgi:hypothetical protein
VCNFDFFSPVTSYLWKKVVGVAIFVLVLYVSLVGVSAVVFFLPWYFVQSLPDVKRDHLVSVGVFSHKVHPLYREWLRHFVRSPDEARKDHAVMDTYSIYGVNHTVTLDEQNQRNDSFGFPNAIRPHDARILFVGDSFGEGASVGSRLAPAAVFAKLTNTPIYNGSHGGYGLAQYVAVIKRMTQDLPEAQRFIGKDIVVLTYLGNDYLSDIMLYEKNDLYENHTFRWLMQLGPLKSWIKYIKASGGMGGPRDAEAANSNVPVGRYVPIPLKCDTAGGLPFALPPACSAYLERDMVMSYLAKARPFLEELKALEVNGLRIKVVVIPLGLQVVYDDIDWQAIPSSSYIAKDVPKIKACLTDVEAGVVKMFKEYGFDTLDLTDIMRNSPLHCQYYQPADTHCTALGYEAIARAIAERWPDIGKGR